VKLALGNIFNKYNVC